MEMNECIDEVPIKWHMIRGLVGSIRFIVIPGESVLFHGENHMKCGIGSSSAQLSNRGTVDSRGENWMNTSLDRNLFLLTARAVMAIGFYLCVTFERKMIANNWNISRWMRLSTTSGSLTFC